MDIERCNSIFELFAAFNFTYAIASRSSNDNHSIGNSFVDIVDENLMKSYTNYISETKRNFTTKITSIKQSVDTFSKRQEVKENPRLFQEISLMSLEASKLSVKLLSWVDKIEDKQKSARILINERFPHISLLLGLFCIAILMLSTSQSSHRHLILALVDTLVILILIKYFSVSQNTKKPIYLNYLLLLRKFFIGITIILILHLLMKFFLVDNYPSLYHKHIKLIDYNIFLRPLTIIVALVLPFSHFAYFFLRFALILRKIKKESVGEVAIIKGRIDELEVESDKIIQDNPPKLNNY